MCGHGNDSCRCLSTLKRTIRMTEDEQSEQATSPSPTFVAEQWTPTNEEFDQALNGRNPPSKIPAVPGRSGSSGVYHKRLSILAKSAPKVSAAELERASKWVSDMARARQETEFAPETEREIEIMPKGFELNDGLREEVEQRCTHVGGHTYSCKIGGIPGKNKVVREP